MAKGIFKISDDISLAISEGLIKDVKSFAKFGFNSNLLSGVEADLWPGPTPIYIFPSDTGEAMEMVSDNVADNQTVLIQALDQDWNEVVINLALNGTTPVPVPGTLTRINRVQNIDSTRVLGTATVRGASAGPTYALMLTEHQISTQVIFSVPAGFKAKAQTAIATLNKLGGADSGAILTYSIRPFGGVFRTGARFGLNKQGSTAATIFIETVDPLPPKTDVVLRVLADANGTDVSSRVPFILYKA